MSPAMIVRIIALDDKVLGIFVEVFRHVMQVHDLFMMACEDVIEWLLQVYPQGQDPEVSHVFSLCRRQVFTETIRQRAQCAFCFLEVLLDGRFQQSPSPSSRHGPIETRGKWLLHSRRSLD